MNQFFDIKAAKRFQKQRHEKKQMEIDARFEKAKNDFDLICKMIIDKYSPKRIFQWGSLLDRTRFSKISDIDIAVEGINNAQLFFNLVADAEKLTDFPLDIVPFEDIHPLHKKTILKQGKLIFENNE